MAVPQIFRRLSPSTKHLSFSTLPTLSSLPSDQTQHLISTVVSLLKHHPSSKSRYTHIQNLYPTGFTPFQFSRIALALRNNPHRVFSFYNFTLTKSLTSHSLLSYSTLIHILSRARQKDRARSVIRSALRALPDSSGLDFFRTLVKTYRRCDSAPFVFDLLVRVLLEYKRIDDCIDVLRMLNSRGIGLNVVTCNELITCVARTRGVESGISVFHEIFQLHSCVFDELTTNRDSVMPAAKSSSELSSVDGNSIRPDVESFGESNTINRNKVRPNVETFNELMICCYQENCGEKVEEIWEEMRRWNCVPNIYSYSVLLAVYGYEERTKEAEKLWEEMRVKGIEYDIMGYNTIIGVFCTVCEMGRVEELLKEMRMSGIEPTCVTYEHLVNGYCRAGDVDSGKNLYDEMCRRGFKAERSTVNAVIRGLCGVGRALDSLEVLCIAKTKSDFCPDENCYATLIKGLCQGGMLEEALKLQSEMVGKGFRSDSEIYGAFSDWYVKQGNEEMVEKLKKEMLGLAMRGEEC